MRLSWISPQAPRALYFNDDVYVGKVREGKTIELVSFDAKQGAIFYLLDEQPADHPTFQRAELDCTQCHVAAGTRGVPGDVAERFFALGFSLEQMRQNLKDLERCVVHWSDSSDIATSTSAADPG